MRRPRSQGEQGRNTATLALTVSGKSTTSAEDIKRRMTTNPGLEDLNKQCERSITKMSDAEALAHIGKLIDDAFDASFERGSKRALYLLDELAKRKLGESDGALVTKRTGSFTSAMLLNPRACHAEWFRCQVGE